MKSFPTRILVIRFSSIGDIVLTTPVVRRLKQQLDGEIEVHYLTKKKFATLLEANPCITQIHTIEKSVQEVMPQLEALELNYIIDLHNNIRSRIVKRKLKSLSFTFHKLNFKKWLWVNFGWNAMPNVHVVDRYLETIKAFSTTDDGRGLDYYIPDGAALKEDALPATHRNGYVAWAIGGMHIGKKMSKEKIAAVCKLVSKPIVLLGGKEDEEDGNYIAQQAGEHVTSAAGKLTWHESASLLRDAALVVTGDTGMMHIASAFGKKIISLWGCTVPGLGMSPYRPHADSVILEPAGRKRRPCSKLGNRCKYGEEKRCIEQIADVQLYEAIEQGTS
ncbi:MAG: glycosyltransferase family 9 protein [Flavobacteriales bacterium]